MKTNMEYLKEFIEGNDEALEFWEAVSKEIKADKDKIQRLSKRVLDSNETTFRGFPKTIDCGIGQIRYTANNLKLQSLMEDVKEKLEHKAKFGVLPDTVSV